VWSKVTIIILSVFVALVLLLISSVTLGLIYWHYPGPLTNTVRLIIKPGTSVSQLSKNLADQQIIRFPFLFHFTTNVARLNRTIKHGEYDFLASMSPKQIVQMMIEGKSVVHKLTIIEGTTLYQARILILENPLLAGELTEEQYNLNVILPDTYFYRYNDNRAQLWAQMHQALTRYIDHQWEKRNPNLPFTTKEEAIILASIVEKETGLDDERARVAAVFVNRLRLNMKLQSDPTVIFGITLGKDPFLRSLTREDLRTPNPYNTYTINGLPPQPIALPSRASIDAVLRPIESSELYFVADGKGGHFFASDLETHNRNVQRYRALLRAR
jgi:UPF0755 protein